MAKGDRIGVLVIGGDFQGLGAIRSLAEKKVPVFLLDYEWSIGRFSRYVNRRARNPLLLSDELFAEYLIDLAKREELEGWVLFPNNDETVKLLSLNRARLNEWYRNPVPEWEIVKNFYFKNKMYEIAEGIQIPIPKMYRGENLNEILIQELNFPIVLKPSYKEKYFPKTKKKAVRVNSRGELIREYQKMNCILDGNEIIVQEMIEGGPQNLYSYAAFFDGEKVIAGMSARRLRQHPMDFGQATTYAESVKIPELKEMATKLLRKIEYIGLAEVEFMKDEKDRAFKFIEINGRIWGWHTLAKAAGINFPYLLFQHMIGEEIETSEAMAGVKWIRSLTDIPTVFKELLVGRMKLRQYFNSLKGIKEFAVFSIRDPLPFFVEYAMSPYLWWKRGF